MQNNRKKIIKLFLFVCAISISLIGCISIDKPQPTVLSSVEAIAGPDAANKKVYIIESGMENISTENLYFQEFSSYIDQVLRRKYFVKNTSNAEIIILMSFGINGPYLDYYYNQLYYQRFLKLTAYDVRLYKYENKIVPVWSISVVSNGSSNNLREIIPYMIVSMSGYIATNTRKFVDITIPLNDPIVESLIRGGF